MGRKWWLLALLFKLRIKRQFLTPTLSQMFLRRHTATVCVLKSLVDGGDPAEFTDAFNGV